MGIKGFGCLFLVIIAIIAIGYYLLFVNQELGTIVVSILAILFLLMVTSGGGGGGTTRRRHNDGNFY